MRTNSQGTVKGFFSQFPWVSARSKRGRRIKSIIAVAYELAYEAAMYASQWPDFSYETNDAAFRVDSHAWKIRDIKPITLAGVLLIARVIVRHAESEADGSKWQDRAAYTLGRTLADSELSVAQTLK